MNEELSKDKAISGFFWTLAERFGAQGVSFVVSIILARLLVPADYGIVAIVTIFTNIANVFVKSGLGTALIQKKDADSKDYSTVFYFNIFFSIVLYALMFFAAPIIADFYQNDTLVSVLRVCSVSLILNGINNVQQAYVSKHLQFKKFFFSTAIGTVISAIVGIILAYIGFGVWALVAQQLLNQIFDTTILHFTIAWKPTREFSLHRLKKMYKFGWKLLVTELGTSVYNNLQSFVIGKKYSSEQLAYYNKGESFPDIIVRNLDNAIQSVTFPVLSHLQDDIDKFKKTMYRGCTLSLYFVCPMMVGMICVADPLVRVLLTEKWIACVPFLQLYCFKFLLRPIEATNLHAINALGRTDLTLKLDIVKKFFGIVTLIGAVFLFDSPIAICVAAVVCSLLNTILNIIAISKLTGYRVIEQLKSFSGIFAIAIVMGIGCFGIKLILSSINPLFILILQVAVGIISYWLLSVIFRLDAYHYVLQYVKTKIRRKN